MNLVPADPLLRTAAEMQGQENPIGCQRAFEPFQDLHEDVPRKVIEHIGCNDQIKLARWHVHRQCGLDNFHVAVTHKAHSGARDRRFRDIDCQKLAAAGRKQLCEDTFGAADFKRTAKGSALKKPERVRVLPRLVRVALKMIGIDLPGIKVIEPPVPE